jgi:hypothetical protein
MNNEKLLFESFNARYLTFEEIANSFIPNEQYDELIKNNHSLLMGPRGSGKTTLLKMLTPNAQKAWYNINRSAFSPELIPFFGVYIPTDIHWKRQLEQFEKEFSFDERYSELTSKVVVTTNVLISLCKTFSQLLERIEKTDSALQKEADLCKELVDNWSLLKPIAPNIISVEQALLNRLKEINATSKRLKSFKKVQAEGDYQPYYFEDYYDLVIVACTTFEKHFKNHNELKSLPFRWALCFDELEIAPKWLQMDLIDKLRSTGQQNIIFKLTTSPLVSLVDKLKKSFHKVEARQNEDYKIVRTWTFDSRELKKWDIFSEKLIKKRLENKFHNNIDAKYLFGSDSLDRSLQEVFKGENISKDKGYGKGTLLWFLFKEYAKIDPSFRNFLTLKNIKYTNPVPSKEGQENEIFRKIKPIVTFRYQFTKSVNFTSKRRSRKNAPLFYGEPLLYEICDGNPRALIGLIDEFLLKVNRNSDGEVLPFSIYEQSKIITTVSKRYLELLSTHPDSNIKRPNGVINLGTILTRIGDYFFKRLVDGVFIMDPPGTFIIDSKLDEQIVEIMDLAMHLGAIIYLEPDEAVTESGIKGKKFRLSYLLYPNFKIPQREYNAINLSTILNKKDSDKLNQQILFDE